MAFQHNTPTFVHLDFEHVVFVAKHSHLGLERVGEELGLCELVGPLRRPVALDLSKLAGSDRNTTRLCVCYRGVARGVCGAMPPKFLEHIVILCLERQYSRQNSVIRLKSNILLLPKFFWLPTFLGWLRYFFANIQWFPSMGRKRSKMGRAEAIQTWVVYFQR